MLSEICGHVCSKSSQQICVIFLQQHSVALVRVLNKWIGFQGWRAARSFRPLAREQFKCWMVESGLSKEESGYSGSGSNG